MTLSKHSLSKALFLFCLLTHTVIAISAAQIGKTADATVKEQLNEWTEKKKTAHAQKDAEAEGYARKKILIICHNNLLWDEYQQQALDDDMAFWSKNHQWGNYYSAFYSAMGAYIRNDQANIAIEKAKFESDKARAQHKPLGEGIALAVIGLAYEAEQRFDEAVKMHQEATKLLEKESYQDAGLVLLLVYSHLSMNLINSGDEAGAIQMLHEWNRYLDTHSKNIKEGHWIDWLLTSGIIYTHTGDLSLAEGYLVEAAERAVKMGSGAVMSAQTALVELYVKQHKYDKALLLSDSILIGCQMSPHAYMLHQQYRATIADSTGNAVLGAAVYKELYHLADSVKRVEIAEQLDEVRTRYEVDKMAMQQKSTCNYLIFAVTAFLLVLVGWFSHSQQMRKKNRALFQQIQEQDRLTKEHRKMVQHYQDSEEATDNSSNLPAEDLPGDDRQQRWVTCLHNFLLLNNNFANPEIDREDLLAELGTNKTYLFEAVKTVTGKTLQEYINSIRLEEAKTLLANQPRLTAEAIAGACGFNTSRTFYRLFRERYNMSPAEYRHLAAEQATR